MKKTALAVTLILMLAATSMYDLTIHSTKAQSTLTIYIRSNGSVEGTDKIQRAEDVYNLTANLEGSIIVEKDDVLVDGGGYTLRGTGIGNGTELSGRKNVTVKNLKIIQFATGIYIYDYSNPSNNTITGNSVMNCGYALYMDGSHNNTIIGNKFNNNDHGVFIMSSHFNKFKNNQLLDNQRNLGFIGGYLASYTQYMDTSNTIDGKPVYYWLWEQDRTVPQDAGFVALIECENIKIQNLKLTCNGQSILLFSTKNTTITQNTIKDNEVGISVQDSMNITVCENFIANNGRGISIDGKYPVYSQNNKICENSIANNDVGIDVWESSNNTLFRNLIADNRYGIRINRLGGAAEFNIIYQNNFVNSSVDVHGYWHMAVFQEVWVPPPENVWDYNNEGNYWSDYGAKYPNATEKDVSSIWNTPYVISENNQDNYPLMNPVVIPELADEDEDEETPTSESLSTLLIVSVTVTIVVSATGLGLLVYIKKRHRLKNE